MSRPAKPHRDRAERGKGLRRFALSLCLASVAGFGAVFALFTFFSPETANGPVPPLPVTTTAAFPSARPSPIEPVSVNTTWSELDGALSSFPGRTPQEVLREATQKDPSCLVQWNQGQPFFLYGAGASPLHPDSLATAVGRCANAVMLLHRG